MTLFPRYEIEQSIANSANPAKTGGVTASGNNEEAATRDGGNIPGPDSDMASIVKENLQTGIPTLVNMGRLGQAYWVGSDRQRETLEEALLAQGDDTPVFSWGELVVMYDYDGDMRQATYILKRTCTGRIERE